MLPSGGNFGSLSAVVRCMTDSARDWAVTEFTHALLGDPRRVRRLVKMAESLAMRPAGRVTHAFERSCDREGAYRLIENNGFSWTDIADATHVAAAQRAAAFPQVVVPIDGVAFTMVSQAAEFGPISNKGHGSGAHAMTALALSPDGTPLGVLGHCWWTRSVAAPVDWKKDRRPIAERETGHWLRVLDQAVAVLRQHAPSTRPWFQLDRGGDCADVLLHALDLGADVTVRACYDRVVTGGKLWAKAASGTLLGTYRLAIRKPGARPRIATMSVRTREVELHLRPGPRCSGPVRRVKMRVVEARERYRGANGIRWRLLTTMPARSFRDAMAVITAYTRRWRIEEFHLTWKSGACAIEQSWLRSREPFFKWATILSAVASRLERLKFLSRTEPDRSALDEYSREEIDAAIALRKPNGVTFGAIPTLGDMTRWVADLGGYTGKSSGGPPGVRVLGRGLERVVIAAAAIASVRKDPGRRG